MEIILNGCSSLAERFSQINAHLVQKEVENAKNSKERILPAIRKLIRDSDLTTKISALFSSQQNGCQPSFAAIGYGDTHKILFMDNTRTTPDHKSHLVYYCLQNHRTQVQEHPAQWQENQIEG